MIDEIYTEHPYYGSPKITAEIRKRGVIVNHKKVERLMRVMGLEAIVPTKNPHTSKPDSAHRTYPYLLNGVHINHPNHVWGTDITYVRAFGRWFYLVAILDWFSRYVISWELSLTLSAKFCVSALTGALKTATPEIHNSDQGSQFTSEEYVKVLLLHPHIQISMDGRGRCFDNIFTERLWRTVKYEEVYLREYRSYNEARSSLDEYFQKYNHRRLHQSLEYQTPAEVYFGKQSKKITK
jgi:putative transposase